MNSPLRLFVALSLAACATTPQAVPQQVAAPQLAVVKPVSPASPVLPLWPKVTHGTLPNGLHYYVLPATKPEKRAFLWLAVNAGSMVEDDDQRGLAHFAEHMAFNGTAKYPKAEIVSVLEKMGMRFGADLNAYTSYDETLYQLEVPTDVPANVSTGLDILHEWASHVSFDPAEVDKERGVVLEELRLHKGVMERVFDKHLAIELGETRYAKRNVIGLASTLEKAPRDVLFRFYKDWYRPDLMAVIVVGDVEPSSLEQQISARFSDLKAPAAPRPRLVGGVPKPDGTRVSIEADPELTFTSVRVSNLVPHRAEATLADFRLALTDGLYLAMLNERLAIASRRAGAPFTQAAASASGLTREIDSFSRFAVVKGGQVEGALEAVLAETGRVEKLGFTQPELTRALANVTRSYVQSELESSTADSTTWAREITRVFFEHEFMIGQAEEKRLALEVLPKITLDEINSTASRFGGADNRVILISGPEAKALPTRERVLDTVKAAEGRAVEAWKGKEGATTLMLEPPKPGLVVKEIVNTVVGTTEWVLSNGVKVIIKPTDFAADSVSIRGLSPGGLAMATDAEFNNARFTNELVGVGGVGDIDSEALFKLLAGKHLSASTSIDGTTESVSGSSSVSDLELLFQLLHLKMTRPRRDDDMIALARSNTIERLTEAERSPQFQFTKQFQDALTGGNPRARLPSPADVQKVDLDKVFAFFKDRFGDAGDFTFVIVGSTSAADLKPLVEKYLASLPAKGRKERERDAGLRFAKGVVKKKVALEKEAKSQVTLIFHGDETWSKDKERDAFILAEVLNIRLREQLRENLSGVYSVGANGNLMRTPRQVRTFSVSFTCAPERVDALVAATFKEMAEIAKSGVSAEYLDKVKAEFLRARETELRTNGFWLGQLTWAAFYGDDPAIVLDPNNVARRVTSDNVKAAAKRYLDPKQYFQAVLVPEVAASGR